MSKLICFYFCCFSSPIRNQVLLRSRVIATTSSCRRSFFLASLRENRNVRDRRRERERKYPEGWIQFDLDSDHFNRIRLKVLFSISFSRLLGVIFSSCLPSSLSPLPLTFLSSIDLSIVPLLISNLHHFPCLSS